MQMNDEDVVVGLLATMSLSKKKRANKDTLHKILGSKEAVERLAHSVDEEHIKAMSLIDTADFWFIALKRYFPRELLRLYELNLFLIECGKLNPLFGGERKKQVTDTWIDRCLRGVYNDVLVQLDRTLFYTTKFMELHFANIDWPGAVDYIKYMVLSVGENEEFFHRILDPKKDTGLLQEMWRLSLGNYYTESSSTYRCLDTSENYTIGHLIDRAILFFTVVELFDYLRRECGDAEYEKKDETNIREMFMAIAQRVSDNESHSIEDLFSVVPEAFREIVQKRVTYIVDQNYSLYTDREEPYTVLFDDAIDIPSFDRSLYDWILFVDHKAYREKRENIAGITKEMELLKKQESIVWLNMILFEIYVATQPPPVSRKKKPTDESSDSDKRRRVDKAVILQQPDQSYVLSLLEGSGVLSVYHSVESEWKSYPISKGDNIRLSSLVDFSIAYDGEMDEEDMVY